MVAVSRRRVAPSAVAAVDASPSGQLRVLHVVSHFPPDRVGGVGEVAAHIHRALVQRGHDSHVLTTGDSDDDPRVRRIHDRPGAGFTRRSRMFTEWAAGFDIVHLHHGEALPLLVGLHRHDVRTLLTFHVDNRSILRSAMPRRVAGQRVGSWPQALRQGVLLGTAKVALDLVARRFADRLTFISRFGAREITGSDSRDAVIHNGVELSDLAPEDADRCGLLYVGTAGARKRTMLLPAFLVRVRRHIPDARLSIAGFDPADAPELLEAIRCSGLEGAVDFIGPVRRDELITHYRSAAALVVPSSYEGLPMVALEAMSHGLPVVATRAGGIEEAVTDGVSGHLVDIDDVDALADAAVELLLEPDRARSVGAAGRRRVEEEFQVESQIDAYLALYREMVAR